jgi:hypothetical protein
MKQPKKDFTPKVPLATEIIIEISGKLLPAAKTYSAFEDFV